VNLALAARRDTRAYMGTTVTIEAPDAAAVERAFAWFAEIEARCSRFNALSELRQLLPDQATHVSTILLEVVRFALAVSVESEGAFDVTNGHFRDVILDAEAQTIRVPAHVTLDLGAVAKGLAVDAAAHELASCRDFAIDAGGDLYLGGCNPQGEPWRVGVRHPRDAQALLGHVQVSDAAVCTSGDYERGDHIRDPRTGAPCTSVASVTVVAPSAMLADALATAAFVLGPTDGLALLQRMDVAGLILTPDMQRHTTEGLTFAA
jgi:FAD:protein FMN transferase